MAAISGYEFEALVTAAGLVREYRISYLATDRGEQRHVLRTAEWTDVGNATVTAPDCYETARQRTGA